MAHDFPAAVAVTGGGGVLGRRLVRRLLHSGVRRVVVNDRQASAGWPAAVECVAGDILDPQALLAGLADCQVVFHLAALTNVGQSRQEPERYWRVNSLGTACVLDACRKLGVPHVVYTSTSHVYGVPVRSPVDEEHITRPLSIYAASKLAGEVALQGYTAEFGLGSTIARLSNLYGGGLGPETVIGRAVRQAAAGGPIQLYSLTPVRDFVYVDDAVEALWRLAALGPAADCRIVNVGSGRGYTIGAMADTLVRVAQHAGGESIAIETPLQEPPVGIPELILDQRRLRHLTGWTPVISLEDGLTLALREQMGELKDD